jgi:5-oxoprolinase (ATP-hydrolysing) subunit A
MTDILINCDIGERGIENETDLLIMPHIHIANVACGGHAGDSTSARFFTDLAGRYDVIVSAHLSYPDLENFGRKSMAIGMNELSDSLDSQIENLPEATWVKFHGALYNDACTDKKLSETLADWMERRRITHVMTLGGSELAKASKNRIISVVAEFFVERRYTLDSQRCQILVPRSKSYASIHDCGEALEQIRQFIEEHSVKIVVSENPDGALITETHLILAETICVHSDSPIALQLIKGITELGFGRKNTKNKSKEFTTEAQRT